MKKLLLVHAPLVDAGNPIAILDMAPYLRQRGFKVDCYYSNDLPKDENYDVVGLSALTAQGEASLSLVVRLKRRYPDSKVILGGKWAVTMESEDERLLREREIEIVRGSGETYFTGESSIDYDSYPSWNEDDFKRLFKGYHVMTSRGCPFHCHFCNNTEKKVNFFSAKRSVDNMEIVLRTGASKLFILDDVFCLKLKHMKAVYDECKRRSLPIEGKLIFFVHANVINKELVRMIQLFQPHHVEMGIESGDNRMLEVMGKNTTTSKVEESLYQLYDADIKVVGLFMVGFPTESLESLKNTLGFAQRIRRLLTNKWVSFYQPIPNTVGYEMAKEHGMILSRRQWNRNIAYLDHNLTEEDLLTFRESILRV